jgi:branched-chain amino acid transport system permease protein
VRKNLNVIAAYSIMMGLIILVGIFQSWNVALSIFNLCLISAVMTMGANIQWGYAGLINFGIMGYTALGGLAAVLISVDPVQEAWRAGGFDILMCLWLIIVMVLAIRFILKHFEKSKFRTYGIAAIIVAGIVIIRITAEPGIEAIEGVNPAKTGFSWWLWATNYFFLDCWSVFCRWPSFYSWKSSSRFKSRLSGNCNFTYF